jgi:DNA-binding NtrC family response regulator
MEDQSMLLRPAVREFEKNLISVCLKRFNQSRVKTARYLGMTRNGLFMKMRVLGMKNKKGEEYLNDRKTA